MIVRMVMMTTMRIGGGELLYDNGIDRLTRGCAPQTTLERELRSQFEFSRDGVGDHFPSSELKFVNTGTWL